MLFIGIPAVAFIFGTLLAWPVLQLAGDAVPSNLIFICAAVIVVVLTGISYRRVRRLGKAMLAVYWRYSIAASFVAVVGLLVVDLVFTSQLESLEAWRLELVLRFLLAYLPLAVVSGLVALWFAREASRISLTHAFFLVALTVGGGASILSLVRGNWNQLGVYGSATVVGDVILGIAITLFSIWALAHFDVLRRASRRRTVMALLALGVLGAVLRALGLYGYSGDYRGLPITVGVILLFSAVFTLIILGLTYLLRVRRPTEPPNGLHTST